MWKVSLIEEMFIFYYSQSFYLGWLLAMLAFTFLTSSISFGKGFYSSKSIHLIIRFTLHVLIVTLLFWRNFGKGAWFCCIPYNLLADFQFVMIICSSQVIFGCNSLFYPFIHKKSGNRTTILVTSLAKIRNYFIYTGLIFKKLIISCFVLICLFYSYSKEIIWDYFTFFPIIFYCNRFNLYYKYTSNIRSFTLWLALQNIKICL